MKTIFYDDETIHSFTPRSIFLAGPTGRGVVRTPWLRAQNHEVYDFTDPACRKAPEIPPEAFPEQFDPAEHDYGDYLNAVPHWRQAVFGNLEALRRCDLCVLLLPCGADSHADWGVAVGLGRRSIVVGHPKTGERTPSHLWAERIFADETEALEWLAGEGSRPAAEPADFTVTIPRGRYTVHGRRLL